MAAKIQHRRSISAKRGVYEALRIFHVELVKPRTGQSFTAWVNDALADTIPSDYLERGNRMAEEIKAQAKAKGAT